MCLPQDVIRQRVVIRKPKNVTFVDEPRRLEDAANPQPMVDDESKITKHKEKLS